MIHSGVKSTITTTSKAPVYCPLCTHTVEADVLITGKVFRVKPGQKCPHCSSSLDAGYVMRFARAA